MPARLHLDVLDAHPATEINRGRTAHRDSDLRAIGNPEGELFVRPNVDPETPSGITDAREILLDITPAARRRKELLIERGALLRIRDPQAEAEEESIVKSDGCRGRGFKGEKARRNVARLVELGRGDPLNPRKA